MGDQTLKSDVQKQAWPQAYNVASSAIQATLGEVFRTANARFRYVLFSKGSGIDGAAGKACYYDSKDRDACTVTADVSAEGGADAVLAGVFVGTVADGKYCWILEEGPIALGLDCGTSIAESNASADAPLVALSVGKLIIPSATVDGGFTNLLGEEGDSDAQDVASLQASIVKMCVNLPRVCGRLMDVTASAMRAYIKVPV